MLNEVIEAVLFEDEVYTELIEGRFQQDEMGTLRDKRGNIDSFATTRFYLALSIYEQAPILFNAVQMLHYLFHPIKSLQIEQYIDWKSKQTSQE